MVQQTEVESRPSALRAWLVLVVQSFQRHWRVRQLGWISLGLLALIVAVVVLFTERGRWDLSNHRARRSVLTYAQEAEALNPRHRYLTLGWMVDTNVFEPGKPNPRALRQLHGYDIPTPLDPTQDALRSLLLSVPQAVLASSDFRHGWGFMTFSRWVVHIIFLGFVLPLFTLSYASSAFGTDRESRSLVWLMTRPIPRGGIYLAKFLGTLPWCMLFGMGGFVALCLAGGDYGREAFARYWPAAAMATLTFAALFHLIGALFRRPVVVGLVYVFFFEAIVAALPGSLKLLSLTFYVRSLMYNEAAAVGYPLDLLPSMTQPISSHTAWVVLAAATVGLTLLGMWLFARSEYRDDI